MNRRAATRYRFDADIEIDWDSTVIRGRIRDISRGGMFIEIAETPRVHAEFSARLVVDAPLPIWCVVQRVVSDQGIGIVIVVVDRDSRQRFDELLRTLRATREPTATGSSSPRRTSHLNPYQHLVAPGCQRSSDSSKFATKSM